MTAVVGLDLSLTGTGIAWDGGQDTIGSKLRGVERLADLHVHIMNHVRSEAGLFNRRSALVVIEGYSYNSKTSQAHSIGELGGVIRFALLRADIPYVDVPPATLKKYATGKGNATKADMRVALLKRRDLDLRDDNQVDAEWLRLFGLHLLGTPAVDLPKTHLAALDAVTLPAVLAADGRPAQDGAA